MKNRFLKAIFGLGCLSVIAASCSRDKISTTPQISNQTLSDSEIHVGFLEQDTIILTFDFTDGDGDISGSLASIYFKDELDSAAQLVPFPFPQIADGTIDPDKGARGTAIVLLASTASVFPILDSATLRDTVRLSYFLRDQMGNQSNTLITPNIILLNP